MVLPCFVFLKQKTSYEMRISDWSSDVCSSDLAAFFGRGGYVAGIAALHAFEGSAFLAWPVEIGGSESMLVIWLLAMAASAVVALAIGAVSLRTTRSEEHTSELQSLMRISYAVFCLKKKKKQDYKTLQPHHEYSASSLQKPT